MRRRASKAWDNLSPIQRAGVVVLGLAFAGLVAAFLLKWAPEWLADDDLTGTDRAEDVGRTRTAVLASLAGLIAVAGAVFTGLSYRLNRAGQITERFTRAIDQLGATDQAGNAKLDVRLGGIFALERIARDSKDDHPQVVEVLTAYVQEHARCKPNNSPVATASGEPGHGDDSATPDEAPQLASDIQAAMSVLARREVYQDRPNTRFNFARTDLRQLVLDAEEGAHLEGAILYGARLEGATIYRAHLQGSNLEGAHLEGADLHAANLEEARLDAAHLEGANLPEAHLEAAHLDAAHLDRANLYGAHLERARLAAAHLYQTNLYGAHLEEARLDAAHLEGANLPEAHLEGAHLEGAHLERANLGGAHLEGACLTLATYDDGTVWPTPEFESEARARGARHIDDNDDDDRSAASHD